MSDNRVRLPVGSIIDEKYKVIEYMQDEDTSNSLVYKVSDLRSNINDNLDYFMSDFKVNDDNYTYIFQEYYPEKGCVRSLDGAVYLDELEMTEDQFSYGRALFFKEYIRVSKAGSNCKYGRAIDYVTFNETVYTMFYYKDFEYQKKLNTVLSYTDIPDVLLPSHEDKLELVATLNNTDILISGGDFNNKVYLNYIDKALDAFSLSLRSSLEADTTHLRELIYELDRFEGTDEGEEVSSCIDIDESILKDRLDKELADDSEWNVLRFLCKSDDQFFDWCIPGNCGGVLMSRNGRIFRRWNTWIA
ncbi:MAG: hypothetical protein DIZ80_08070 [endosymbiont of Galathealinum brachiosum]|uniref:Uncharacterized protein n=1 Tax=endosymbiont of Galathealinum brachiosum TaxID=2200906 RepID=A0A370DHS6_9GAMM|nr:MAG: hypothetical protein DIZ80_08070 [endosymbiont of Galathealinum brachiosum]